MRKQQAVSSVRLSSWCWEVKVRFSNRGDRLLLIKDKTKRGICGQTSIMAPCWGGGVLFILRYLLETEVICKKVCSLSLQDQLKLCCTVAPLLFWKTSHFWNSTSASCQQVGGGGGCAPVVSSIIPSDCLCSGRSELSAYDVLFMQTAHRLMRERRFPAFSVSGSGFLQVRRRRDTLRHVLVTHRRLRGDDYPPKRVAGWLKTTDLARQKIRPFS